MRIGQDYSYSCCFTHLNIGSFAELQVVLVLMLIVLMDLELIFLVLACY